jgi:hypothetical protein
MLIGNDHCTCFIDVLYLPYVSLASLRFRCTSSVEEMGNDTDLNIENKTKNESISTGNVRTNIVSNNENMRVDSNPHQPMKNEENNNFRSNKTSPLANEPITTYSSTAISLQRACGPYLLTDKHQLQLGGLEKSESDELDIFGNDDISLMTDPCIEEVLQRDPIVNIIYNSGSTAGGRGRKPPVVATSAVSEAPTLLSATTTVNTPVNSAGQKGTDLSNYALKGHQPKVILSFEAILKSFLRLIPFHVVEIWVPVQLEGGSTVLLYGASAAVDKELHGWSSYSRNFSFNPDVGLPGRVASARSVESQIDVAKLPAPTFLRAEMAEELGIHAACGLPFCTGNKCDAVVVFYSKHIFEPTPELVEYMGRICEMLNIRAQIRILKK